MDTPRAAQVANCMAGEEMFPEQADVKFGNFKVCVLCVCVCVCISRSLSLSLPPSINICIYIYIDIYMYIYPRQDVSFESFQAFQGSRVAVWGSGNRVPGFRGYRVTSLIRERLSLGPLSRPMSRVLWCS